MNKSYIFQNTNDFIHFHVGATTSIRGKPRAGNDTKPLHRDARLSGWRYIPNVRQFRMFVVRQAAFEMNSSKEFGIRLLLLVSGGIQNRWRIEPSINSRINSALLQTIASVMFSRISSWVRNLHLPEPHNVWSCQPTMSGKLTRHMTLMATMTTVRGDVNCRRRRNAHCNIATRTVSPWAECIRANNWLSFGFAMAVLINWKTKCAM